MKNVYSFWDLQKVIFNSGTCIKLKFIYYWLLDEGRSNLYVKMVMNMEVQNGNVQ